MMGHLPITADVFENIRITCFYTDGSRSPDLNSIDFFFWGALKIAVYVTPVNSELDLVARIVCAAVDIQQSAGIFQSVRQSMVRRCNACFASNGSNIEHFL